MGEGARSRGVEGGGDRLVPADVVPADVVFADAGPAAAAAKADRQRSQRDGRQQRPIVIGADLASAKAAPHLESGNVVIGGELAAPECTLDLHALRSGFHRGLLFTPETAARGEPAKKYSRVISA